MSVEGRLAKKISRAHRYLKPLLDRGRDEEVLFQSGKPRIRSRALAIAETDFVDFATTSYLGLDSDPAVIQACIDGLQSSGLHRYISRAFFSVKEYTLLEERLARIVGLPRAIVFPSVTSLHQTLLPLMTGGIKYVIADEQVHHSIHEALKACDDVQVNFTPHNDLAAVESALKKKGSADDALILADGVYSLEGEIAPIERLYDLAVQSGSLLYLDDSHGFGVFGDRGEGVLYRLRGDRNHLVYVGSLSKAMGCYGGFVATPESLGIAIRNYAGGLMFSGPLPTTLLSGALAACEILLSPRLSGIHARLWDNQQLVIAALRNAGMEPLSTETPIICVDFVSFNRFKDVVITLRDHHILVSVVAFPAVPRGHYRIRLSISANHSKEDIGRLAAALLETNDRQYTDGKSPVTTAR